MPTTTQGQAKRPSISDVARRAGVSVGTVSNVLNRPDQVAPPTRERVHAAIQELRFVRNATARQLRVGTGRSVGAILRDIADPASTEVARGLEDRLAQDDVTLLLSSSDDEPAREARCLRLHEDHGVQGLVVTPSADGVTAVRALRERGVPVVLLDAPVDVDDVPGVRVDDARGAALAVEHLLGLGHRRLALVAGPDDPRSAARRAGVLDALAAADLDVADVLTEVAVPATTADAGVAAAQDLLAVPADRRPTATICLHDVTALGLLRALRRAGVRVPDDMAVVGHDDIAVASMLATPLTSVRRPSHALGRAAAELLLSSVAEPDAAPRQVLLEPELVVRASTVGLR